MAKKAKAKASKAKSKKKSGKAKVGKAKVQKKAALQKNRPQPIDTRLLATVSKHVFESLSDKKSDAVNSCVNAEMDRVTDSWNDSGNMAKDYKQTPKSMRAFLSDVQDCLKAKGFDFNMNDPGLIKDCLKAAVWQLKLLVYGRTK
jgi:hypothetical protein